MVHFGTVWYNQWFHILVHFGCSPSHHGTLWYSMVHFDGIICGFLFWYTLVVQTVVHIFGALCEEMLAFTLVRPTACYTLVQYGTLWWYNLWYTLLVHTLWFPILAIVNSKSVQLFGFRQQHCC